MTLMFWIVFAASILAIAAVDGWLARRKGEQARAAAPGGHAPR